MLRDRDLELYESLMANNLSLCVRVTPIKKEFRLKVKFRDKIALEYATRMQLP